MGYVISYESLRDIFEQMSSMISSIMNERLPKINEVLLEYIYEEGIQGKTADTIKTYLIETHGTILIGIDSVLKQFLAKFVLYQNGYYEIDSNRDTVIDENYLEDLKEVVNMKVHIKEDLMS